MVVPNAGRHALWRRLAGRLDEQVSAISSEANGAQFFQCRKGSSLLVPCIRPRIYREFTRIYKAHGTRREQSTTDEVYENLVPVNFSKEIMKRIAIDYPKAISVFAVRGVFWSDLSSRERVSRVPRRLSYPKPTRFRLCPTIQNLSRQKRENYRRRSVLCEALRFGCE
jgi:hypothetical protein